MQYVPEIRNGKELAGKASNTNPDGSGYVKYFYADGTEETETLEPVTE